MSNVMHAITFNNFFARKKIYVGDAGILNDDKKRSRVIDFSKA